MNKKEYIEVVKESVIVYLENYINDCENFLKIDFDDLREACSGVARGSYTMDPDLAAAYISECPELVSKCLKTYHVITSNAERIDSLIRCYILDYEIDIWSVWDDVIEKLIIEDINRYLNGGDELEIVKKFVYYPEEFKKVAEGANGFAGLYGLISQEAEQVINGFIERYVEAIKSCDADIETIEDDYNRGKYDSKTADRLIDDAILSKRIEIKKLEKYQKLKELIARREYPDEYDDVELIQIEIFKIRGEYLDRSCMIY